jgi:hypothetical protein
MHYFNLHFSYYFDNLNLYDKKHSTSSNLTLAGIFYFADRGKFSFYDLSFFSFNRSSLSGLWNGASVSSYISFAFSRSIILQSFRFSSCGCTVLCDYEFLFPFLGYSLSTIQPILCPGSVYLWGFIYWLRFSSHLGFRYGKCVFTTVFL